MATEKVSALPTVSNATLGDVIYAIQGGNSVQETLQQVANLTINNTILNYPGNPNGNLAGTVYQLCWDTTDKFMYVCTTTGSASTAVWTQITAGSGTFDWVTVTGTSAALNVNTGYIANNSALVTLTMPSVSSVGQEIDVLGFGAGGWSIAQPVGVSINVGSSQSTVGAGGSVSSTLPSDCITLICTVANSRWAAYSYIGNLNVV